MRTGTTPTHSFTSDLDLTNAEKVWISYKQGKTILRKEKEQLEIEPELITVRLEQEDTLLFDEGTIKMQIRARFPDGSAFKTKVMHTTADELLEGGVI